MAHSARRCERPWRATSSPMPSTVAVVQADAALAHGVEVGADALGAAGELGELAGEAGERAEARRAACSSRPVTPRLRLIQSPTTGSAVVHMSNSESSRRATPSTTTMVFCRSTSSGPRLHVENLGHLEEQAEQLRHGDLAGAVAVDRLADRPERLGKILRRVDGRHVARLDVDLGDALIVAADEAVEDLRQEAALLRPDAAHDAEIDGDQAAFRVDEEVPLVHVGVEEAVAQAHGGGRTARRWRRCASGHGRRRGSPRDP